MVSVKNGISSVRVRSSPNANAIVDSFFMEFKRSYKKNRFIKNSTRFWMPNARIEKKCLQRKKRIWQPNPIHTNDNCVREKKIATTHVINATLCRNWFVWKNKKFNDFRVYLLGYLHFSIRQLKRRWDTMNRRTLYHWQPLFCVVLYVSTLLSVSNWTIYVRIVDSIACVSCRCVCVCVYATTMSDDVGRCTKFRLFNCVISMHCPRIPFVQTARFNLLTQKKVN